MPPTRGHVVTQRHRTHGKGANFAGEEGGAFFPDRKAQARPGTPQRVGRVKEQGQFAAFLAARRDRLTVQDVPAFAVAVGACLHLIVEW